MITQKIKERMFFSPIRSIITFWTGSGAAACAVWAVTVAAACGVAIMAEPMPRPAEPGCEKAAAGLMWLRLFGAWKHNRLIWYPTAINSNDYNGLIRNNFAIYFLRLIKTYLLWTANLADIVSTAEILGRQLLFL